VVVERWFWASHFCRTTVVVAVVVLRLEYVKSIAIRVDLVVAVAQ
jgi:hypothetical protein